MVPGYLSCELFRRAGNFGQSQNRAANLRVIFRFQKRQEFVANAVPRVGARLVGRILAVRGSAPGQETQDFCAMHAEERPQERRRCGQRPRTGNSRQSRNSGPAQKVKEHGLHLIVRRVGRRHVAGSCGIGRAGEKRITQIAQRLLGTAVGRGRMLHHALQSQFGGQLGHGLLVGRGFRPPLPMIEVGQDNPPRTRHTQLTKAVGQRRTVRAAACRDQHRHIAPILRRPAGRQLLKKRIGDGIHESTCGGDRRYEMAIVCCSGRRMFSTT